MNSKELDKQIKKQKIVLANAQLNLEKKRSILKRISKIINQAHHLQENKKSDQELLLQLQTT